MRKTKYIKGLILVLLVQSFISFAGAASNNQIKEQNNTEFLELQSNIESVSEKEFSKNFGYKPENDLSLNSIGRLFEIVREVFSQPSKIKIISQAFEDLLILDPESLKKVRRGELEAPVPYHVLSRAELARVKNGEKIEGISFLDFREKKIISEARFFKLLRLIPREWKDIERFLEEYPRENKAMALNRLEYDKWDRDFYNLKYEKYDIKHHKLKDERHLLKKAQKQFANDKTDEAKLLVELSKEKIAKMEARLKELEKELNEVRPRGPELQAEYQKEWDELRKVDNEVFKERFAQTFRNILKTQDDINSFIKENNDTKPILLYRTRSELKKGLLGYELVDFRATTPLVYSNKKVEQARSIEEMLIEFVDGARKTLSLNFYEWDVPSLRDALIRAHKRNVKISASFDREAMSHYPERMELYYELMDYVINSGALKDGSFRLKLIKTSHRNHQKMAVRDKDSKTRALTYFASANATYSGMLGDLASSEYKHEKAISNGNHAYTIKSRPLANIVHHNLEKTQTYNMRGTSGINAYPKSGSFLIRGERGGYIIIGFTPNGGDGDIHKSMTKKAISHSHGPLRVLQFSASSETVLDAMLERAKKEIGKNPKWRMQAVSDSASFLSDWSIFLKMAGLKRLNKKEQKKLKKRFDIDPESEWRKALGDQFERVMGEIRTAPAGYGMFYIRDENGRTLRDPITGRAKMFSAKMHHKTIIAGKAWTDKKTRKPLWVVVDGSANATDASLKNQEYQIVSVDFKLSEKFDALFRGIYQMTTPENGILQKAERDNKIVEEEYRSKDPQAKKRKQQSLEYKGDAKNGFCSTTFKSAS